MTIIGLLVNVFLGMVKLVAGIFGHSGALIADAIESLADIAGSLVIWSGLAIGALPPDEDHPYGHGKAEGLAGLTVAVLVFAAGVSIVAKAAHDVRTPHESPEPFTLIVLVTVIAIKTSLFLATRRVARQEGSGAVAVDAGHHVADAITSVAAAIGISIALFGERWFGDSTGFRWETADDWAAIFAGGIILYNAVGLARIPLRELMDTSTPEDTARVIEPARGIARGVEGVRDIEKLQARKSGAQYWLEMHVQVDPNMPVRDAHVVGGKVRATIRAEMPIVRDVLVHIEPFEAKPGAQ
jgi:cation diffusion facilitator family transporter